MVTTPDLCPLCGADLTGEPIPDKDRDYYGGQTHFSRAKPIFTRLPMRVAAYRCPDCNGTWPMEGQQK